VQGGSAHIAVRGISGPGAAASARRLERRLASLAGVRRAEVTAPLGRVAVNFDEAVLGSEDLVQAIDAFERNAGLDGQPFAAVSHPADWEPIVREAVLVGAGLVGSTVALVGRASRLPPLPPVIPTLLALADSTPRLRGQVENLLGPPATNALLLHGGAVAQTLSQRPLNLVVDAAYRCSLLSEALLQRRAWQRREEMLADEPGAFRAGGYERPDRPVPVPDGPLETVSAVASAAAAVAAAGTLVATRRADRATAVLGAGIMRAGMVARESFAAQLGRTCAARDIVVLDSAALRRLDRVDVVVFDASVLHTGDVVIEEVLPVVPDVRFEELYLHAHALVDLDDLAGRREREEWVVRPLGRSAPAVPDGARAAAREWSRQGATVLAIERDGRLAGLVRVVREMDPLAEAVVAQAHAAGSVLLAGKGSGLQRRLAVDGVVAGGAALLSSILELQRAGRCVALVSLRGGSALAAADVGVGVTRNRRPPWGAHVHCGRSLADVSLLVQALPVARRVSVLGVRLSVAAAVLSTALGVLGRSAMAPRRAALPVPAAAAVGLGLGTWFGLTVAARPPPAAAARTAWHAMPTDAVLRLLRSAEAGLDEQEATRRQHPDGTAPPGEVGVARATVEELANPITAALAVSATISVLLGSALDAALIAAVLGFNGLIGGLQRRGADRALRTLSQATATRVRVRRRGMAHVATADQLVPGDVIDLRAGESVPADCRLLAAAGLEVDESALTGESLPVEKTPAPTPAYEVADRHSMVYEGTAVAAGSGHAVVTAVGVDTEIGRTVRGTAQAPRPAGVEARLRSLMRVSVPISAGAGIALLASVLARGGSVRQTVGPAVNLAVAAVPEGLPFVATVAELAAARRLSGRGTLVRQPATLEALGRVDVLCFDKTGTLTEGRIVLRRVSDGGQGLPADRLSPRLREVLAAAVRASPVQDGQDLLPHSTDRAVLNGARDAGVDATEGPGGWQPVAEMPFESGRSFHAVLGRRGGNQLLAVKGAPEVLLDRCTMWQRPHETVPLDAARRREVESEVERLTGLGYRVLAVAERPASERPDLDESRVVGLHLVGFLALADRIRPAAATAVENLRQAGVSVVMVTGDHPGTATVIADELDALNGRQVMTGVELDGLDDADLAQRLTGVAVFARVTPAQKVRIVQGLRAAGCVVAVTGDGANDAPAIRLADVGLALGTGATAAAREAADIVVTDDRLETIVDAILEGRAMWASVRDALTILLGGNLGEVMFTLAGGLLSGHSVLSTRQLMVVNMLTDVLPAMAVALRPPPTLTREVLKAEGPESSLGTPLLQGIGIRAGVTGAAASAAWLVGRVSGTAAHASTVGLVALVAAQLGQTLAAGIRSPLVIIAVVASLVGLAVAVQTPGISHFLGCRPLGPFGWATALAAAAAATVAAIGVSSILRNRTGTGTTGALSG
jgi:cation-transporting P-type ATPase I